MQSINKLPPELLTRIFVTGEDMCRSVRLSGQPYVGFQDLVTQVCRNWRDLAIRTPTLWTYIYLSKPPPHRHTCAELYISRSGTCPLFIDFAVKTSYLQFAPGQEEEQGQLAAETLQFLVTSGATIDRWAGLLVFSRLPQVIISIICFVNSGPTTALRFLSLTWKIYSGVTEIIEYNIAVDGHSLGKSVSHALQMPQLRHVELNGLPNPYIFNRISPMVSNLTCLKYASSESLPSLLDFSALLSASPRLESLVIDMSAVPQRAGQMGYKAVSLAPLELPLLRTLSLDIVPAPIWGFRLLQTINAPKLESFELGVSSLTAKDTVLQELFRYLSTARVSKGVQSVSSLKKESTRCGSIFPSLQYLNIESVKSNSSIVLALLEAFPTIARVTLEPDSLAVLSESPHLFPNASHFTYNNASADSFRSILLFVSRRANAGMRVSTFEISTTILGLVLGTLNGGGDDMYETYVAPLHQFVDKIEVHLYDPGDSEPSRLSDKNPFRVEFWGVGSDEGD